MNNGKPKANHDQIGPRTDVRAFRRELTPTWISCALMLAGQTPFPTDQPMRVLYADGTNPALSGVSATAAVAAATGPQSEFLHWTPFPDAAAEMATLQRNVGLPNFSSNHWARLPKSDETPGPFNLVVVDGLVDCIDDRMRHDLASAIQSLLAPGGVVTVTYRTIVGWIEIVPVVRLLRHVARRGGRPLEQGMGEAMELLAELRSAGAGYIVGRRSVAAWVDRILKCTPSALVEELFAREFRPASHAQVAAMFQSVQCEYVTSANVGDCLGLDRPAGVAEVLESAPTVLIRELLDDLAVRRAYRADVFRLGGRLLSADSRLTALGQLPLVAMPGAVSPGHDQTSGRSKVVEKHAAAATWLSDHGMVLDELEPDRAAHDGLLRRLMRDGLAHPLNIDVGGREESAAATRLDSYLAGLELPTNLAVKISSISGSATGVSTMPERGLEKG